MVLNMKYCENMCSILVGRETDLALDASNVMKIQPPARCMKMLTELKHIRVMVCRDWDTN